MWFGSAPVRAQLEFEGAKIESVDMIVDGTPQNTGVGETYLRIVREDLGDTYAAVRVRNAIDDLYTKSDVSYVEVLAAGRGAGSVGLTFSVKRKPKAKRVSIEIEESPDIKLTEQELLFRLNLLDPGAVVSDATLESNATSIQEYLRERGFFKARVTFDRQALTANEVAVTYKVGPGEAARIEAVNFAIEGFDAAEVAKDLKLQPGEIYTRELLTGDTERVRSALIKGGFLAPTLTTPEPIYDSDKNTITINFVGRAGPKVEVTVESEKKDLGEGTKKRLLPIVREGTLDYAAIIEGERRLENYYQEKGYFFAQVRAVCSVEPITPPGTPPTTDGTEAACSSLSSEDFKDRKAVVKYRVNLDRRL
jgi:outer membrane protein assembly factor BamA